MSLTDWILAVVGGAFTAILFVMVVLILLFD